MKGVNFLDYSKSQGNVLFIIILYGNFIIK